MNNEELKNMLLKLAENEQFVKMFCKILSNNKDFQNLIEDVNDNIERKNSDLENPYL